MLILAVQYILHFFVSSLYILSKTDRTALKKKKKTLFLSNVTFTSSSGKITDVVKAKSRVLCDACSLVTGQSRSEVDSKLIMH